MKINKIIYFTKDRKYVLKYFNKDIIIEHEDINQFKHNQLSNAILYLIDPTGWYIDIDEISYKKRRLIKSSIILIEKRMRVRDCDSLNNKNTIIDRDHDNALLKHLLNKNVKIDRGSKRKKTSPVHPNQ